MATLIEDLNCLSALQSPSGAFGSQARIGSDTFADWNGFTTALILRTLAPLRLPPSWNGARERALDFLQSCEAPNRKGFYAFWPRNQWPSWAPQCTEDADDTAVLISELVRHGRMAAPQARGAINNALVPYRATFKQLTQHSWVRPGVFLTWLREDLGINLVDCCVNANVIGLMAQVGSTAAPGYPEACEMLRNAIAWAGSSAERLSLLMPYYANPRELVWALRNAIECGALPLLPVLGELQSNHRNGQATCRPDDPLAPFVRTEDNKIIWTSRALFTARAIRARLFTEE